jgi:hypothetical protein
MRIGWKMHYLQPITWFYIFFFAQDQNFSKIHKTDKKIILAKTKKTCLMILNDKPNCQVSRILMIPRPILSDSSENDPVLRVGLLLNYLIGTQPGRVKGGRIEFWRRLCMSRSRGKSLDSFYNRVHHPFCTLETIPPGPASRYCLANPGLLDHCM